MSMKPLAYGSSCLNSTVARVELIEKGEIFFSTENERCIFQQTTSRGYCLLYICVLG